jgi:heme/copper-type cytochrome/quinol oxidase subunit 2
VIDTRHEFAGLFTLYLWVTVGAVVVVFAVTLFAVIRFRREDGPARGKDKAPLAETLYALGLAVIAALLLAATFRTENRVDPVRASPGLHIAITGFQWQWRFDYDSGRSVLGTRDTLPTLVVPVDTLIRFTATSTDVIHSFWIPSVRFKRDAFPYRTTTFDLVFDHEGTLIGHCAEFCGLRHTNMDFYVRVVSADAFRAWERSG